MHACKWNCVFIISPYINEHPDESKNRVDNLLQRHVSILKVNRATETGYTYCAISCMQTISISTNRRGTCSGCCQFREARMNVIKSLPYQSFMVIMTDDVYSHNNTCVAAGRGGTYRCSPLRSINVARWNYYIGLLSHPICAYMIQCWWLIRRHLFTPSKPSPRLLR